MTKTKKVVFGALVGIPIVCCLGGGLVFLGATRKAHAAVEKARTDAQAAGMPLSFADVIPHPVDPETNAAPLYERAAASLGGRMKPSQEAFTRGRAVTAKPEQRAAAIQAFKMVEPVLASLSSLPSRPNCQFERNWQLGNHLTFPELFPMKALTTDFCLQAEDLDAAGDKAGALRSLGLADRVAEDAGSDPILIATLVQCACEEICNHEYEKIIGLNTRNVELLTQMEDQLRRFEVLPDLRHALAGEIVLDRYTLRTVETPREFTESSSEDGPPKPSGAEKMFFGSAFARDTFEAELLDKWRISWVKFPKDKNDWAAYGSALKSMQDAVDADHSFANRINQVLMPVFSRVPDVLGLLQARYRLLMCSIELLKVRDRDGKLPSALPSELGELGIDPFDGKPLRYIPKGQGFTLYSVGRDRIDNGGRKRTSYDSQEDNFDEVMEFE